MRGGRVLRDALRLEGRRITAAARVVRGDATSAEAVHDLRVALRRLRSVLHGLRPWLHGRAVADLDAQLRRLATAVRPVREFDVLLATFDEFAEFVPAELASAIREPWLRRLEQCRQDLATELAGDPLAAVSEALGHLRRRHLYVARDPDTHLQPRLDRVVRRAERRLSRAASRANVADLHRVRILAKRLRYMADFADACSASSRHAESAQYAQHVQTILGRVQDLTVLEATLAEQIGDDPRLRIMREHIAAAREDALGAWRTLSA